MFEGESNERRIRYQEADRASIYKLSLKVNIMNKTLSTLLTSISIAAASGIAIEAHAGAGAGKEKCYGVSKAGKNDCATKSSSCAGTSKSHGQQDAFIVVPEGLCGRLVGGSTQSS